MLTYSSSHSARELVIHLISTVPGLVVNSLWYVFFTGHKFEAFFCTASLVDTKLVVKCTVNHSGRLCTIDFKLHIRFACRIHRMGEFTVVCMLRLSIMICNRYFVYPYN